MKARAFLITLFISPVGLAQNHSKNAAAAPSTIESLPRVSVNDYSVSCGGQNYTVRANPIGLTISDEEGNAISNLVTTIQDDDSNFFKFISANYNLDNTKRKKEDTLNYENRTGLQSKFDNADIYTGNNIGTRIVNGGRVDDFVERRAGWQSLRFALLPVGTVGNAVGSFINSGEKINPFLAGQLHYVVSQELALETDPARIEDLKNLQKELLHAGVGSMLFRLPDSEKTFGFLAEKLSAAKEAIENSGANVPVFAYFGQNFPGDMTLMASGALAARAFQEKNPALYEKARRYHGSRALIPEWEKAIKNTTETAFAIKDVLCSSIENHERFLSRDHKKALKKIQSLTAKLEKKLGVRTVFKDGVVGDLAEANGESDFQEKLNGLQNALTLQKMATALRDRTLSDTEIAHTLGTLTIKSANLRSLIKDLTHSNSTESEREKISELQEFAEKKPGEKFILNFESKKISCREKTFEFEIPEERRKSLLDGSWDTLGLLLSNLKKVKEKAKELPYLNF